MHPELELPHYWGRFLLCAVSFCSAEVRSHHGEDNVSPCDLGFSTKSKCSKDILQRHLEWRAGKRWLVFQEEERCERQSSNCLR